jgi:hypothetical protein
VIEVVEVIEVIELKPAGLEMATPLPPRKALP